MNSNNELVAAFPVRNIDFDFSIADKYFYKGDPATSFFLAAMQSFFPDGEQFFIDSVRAYRDQITDPQLQKDIGAFIGQEAMHGKAHRYVNEVIMEKEVNVNQFVVRIERLFNNLRKNSTQSQQLAITASLEHFTAVMGAGGLRNEQFIDSISNEEIRKLIRWHAIEECEHKAVAFDTYKAIGGSYFERIYIMVLTTIGVIIVFGGATARLMRDDKQLSNMKSWNNLRKNLFAKGGMFSGTLKEYLAWYKPSFHPKDYDTRSLETYWKKKLGL
jgi:uncharacterized protein